MLILAGISEKGISKCADRRKCYRRVDANSHFRPLADEKEAQ
jgi:hypothetical protein